MTTIDFKKENVLGCLKSNMSSIFWCFKRKKQVIGGGGGLERQGTGTLILRKRIVVSNVFFDLKMV